MDSENIWLAAARSGDKQAFSQLVDAYARPVYNLTYRMLGNPQEAEDAAQETFLRAFARLGQYDESHKFSTWILSIANHHCIDRLRKRRMVYISIDDNPVLENLSDAMAQPEHAALDRELSAEVQQLMMQLEPDYRTPVVLRYWEELSYEEIATAMDITVSAVKSRLFRARQKLATLMAAGERAMLPPSTGLRTAAAVAMQTRGVEAAHVMQTILAGV